MSSPPYPNKETNSQKSIQRLDDVMPHSNLEMTDYTFAVEKLFEVQVHDYILWNFLEM